MSDTPDTERSEFVDAVVNRDRMKLCSWPYPLLRCGCASLVLILSCVVLYDDNPVVAGMVRADRQGDTVSVYAALRIAFVFAARDSIIELDISPPIPSGYSLSLSSRRDTLVFQPIVPLEGSTRYVLRPAYPVRTIDGSTLDPLTDSIVFHTFPAEAEPNNSLSTADPLSGIICGIITPANDTDFFYLGLYPWKALVIQALDSPCGYGLIGSSGNLLNQGRTSAMDTIRIHSLPDTARYIFLVSATPTARDRYILRGIR